MRDKVLEKLVEVSKKVGRTELLLDKHRVDMLKFERIKKSANEKEKRIIEIRALISRNKNEPKSADHEDWCNGYDAALKDVEKILNESNTN